jgi:hypothetical protein
MKIIPILELQLSSELEMNLHYFEALLQKLPVRGES